jgi:hypothetical protein
MIDSSSVSQRTALISECALLAGKKKQSTHCRDLKFGQVFLQTLTAASDQELTTMLIVTSKKKNKSKECMITKRVTINMRRKIW